MSYLSDKTVKKCVNKIYNSFFSEYNRGVPAKEAQDKAVSSYWINNHHVKILASKEQLASINNQVQSKINLLLKREKAKFDKQELSMIRVNSFIDMVGIRREQALHHVARRVYNMVKSGVSGEFAFTSIIDDLMSKNEITPKIMEAIRDNFSTYWKSFIVKHKPRTNDKEATLAYKTACERVQPLIDRLSGNVKKEVKVVTPYVKPVIVEREVKNAHVKVVTKKIEVQKKEVELKPLDRYFNTEAYQLALRTTTQPEAWKIATSVELSTAFLGAKATNVLTVAVEAVIERSTPSVNVSSIGRVVEVTHKARHTADQADFSRRVRQNFNNVCSITGYSLPILQACHIEEFAEGQDMSTDNGLLLDPTLHALLDKGLMAINPASLTVHFKVECVYSMYEGKELQPHKVALDKTKLAAKWEKFNG